MSSITSSGPVHRGRGRLLAAALALGIASAALNACGSSKHTSDPPSPTSATSPPHIGSRPPSSTVPAPAISKTRRGGWKTVSYGAVAVQIPATWKMLTGEQGLCGTRYGNIVFSTITSASTISCPAVPANFVFGVAVTCAREAAVQKPDAFFPPGRPRISRHDGLVIYRTPARVLIQGRGWEESVNADGTGLPLVTAKARVSRRIIASTRLSGGTCEA